jgi:hypothetical protein
MECVTVICIATFMFQFMYFGGEYIGGVVVAILWRGGDVFILKVVVKE